ncbi:MAG TPA: hypothetical protein VFG86_27775, partial [Chloroflexota bacterium]|nr:hypothetical protein [Chloroflexota bacterium]
TSTPTAANAAVAPDASEGETRQLDVAGVTTWAGPTCVTPPDGQPLTPPAPPTLVLTLGNGQRVQLTLDAGVLAVLPAGWELTLRFEPWPLAPYATVDTALAGANAWQAGDPFHLRVLVIDCVTGDSLTLPTPLLDYPVRVSLPVLPVELAGETAPDTQFAWFRAVWNVNTFSGYLRIDAPRDMETNTLLFSATLADVQSALFLPALVAPSYVENTDPDVHLWSGPRNDVGVGPDTDVEPSGDAGTSAVNETVDFGLAATHQFTVFKVVGPPVEGRLFVANLVTGSYGWIDVTGVGPSGPPL